MILDEETKQQIKRQEQTESEGKSEDKKMVQIKNQEAEQEELNEARQRAKKALERFMQKMVPDACKHGDTIEKWGEYLRKTVRCTKEEALQQIKELEQGPDTYPAEDADGRPVGLPKEYVIHVMKKRLAEDD